MAQFLLICSVTMFRSSVFQLFVPNRTSLDQSTDPRDRRLQRWLMGTIIFNVIDLIMTLFVVLTGLALEANPLLADLIEQSPLAFGATKIILVSLGVALIWMHRRRALAYAAGALCFGAYMLVMGVHLQGVVLASL